MDDRVIGVLSQAGGLAFQLSESMFSTGVFLSVFNAGGCNICCDVTAPEKLAKMISAVIKAGRIGERKDIEKRSKKRMFLNEETDSDGLHCVVANVSDTSYNLNEKAPGTIVLRFIGNDEKDGSGLVSTERIELTEKEAKRFIKALLKFRRA